MYYGFNYMAGVAVDSNGCRYGNYTAFASKKERDNWVDLGSDFRTEPHYRIKVSTKDPELSRLICQADSLCKKGETLEQAYFSRNIYIHG